MDRECERIQELLAGDQREELQKDSQAEDHLAECESCYAFLQSLTEIDSTFGEFEEENVSESIVQKLIQKVQDEPIDSAEAAQLLNFSRLSLKISAILKSIFDWPRKKFLSLSDIARRGIVAVLVGVLVVPLFSMDLITYMEGSFGALLMLLAGMGAILCTVLRNYRAGMGLCVAACALFMVRGIQPTFFNDQSFNEADWSSSRTVAPRSRTEGSAGAGAMGQQEAYGDLIGSFKSELEESRADAKRSREEVKELQRNFENSEERTAQVFKKMLERMESDAQATAQMSPESVAVGGPEAAAKVDSRSARDLSSVVGGEAGGVGDKRRGYNDDLVVGEDEAEEVAQEFDGQLVWEEPQVDALDVPAGLDSEGHYYRPKNQHLAGVRRADGKKQDRRAVADAFEVEKNLQSGNALASREAQLPASVVSNLKQADSLNENKKFNKLKGEGTLRLAPSKNPQKKKARKALHAVDKLKDSLRKSSSLRAGERYSNDNMPSDAEATPEKEGGEYYDRDVSGAGGAFGMVQLGRSKFRQGRHRGNAPARVQSAKQAASSPDVSSDLVEYARAYLKQRQIVDGLKYKDAKGYWLNTYVPGDPAFRAVYAGLKNKARDGIEQYTGPLQLEDLAVRPRQPFDVPRNAALATYIHADKTGLEEKGRLLVQVGIQGTSRHSGARPPMNVGLVLDLSGNVPLETARKFRALVSAFEQAKDIGDRFSLVVAGRPGGMLLEPASFRHGPVRVAMENLFKKGKIAAPSLSLPQAMEKALASVRGADDPTAPLGSSVVIVVTAQQQNDLTPHLVKMAHTSAVAGIPVSMVGIGNQIAQAELERIALAGQGNRRLLNDPADARRVADAELLSVSRVVARAVRLRIRLAPGVKLVNVLSSRRLGEPQAQRVRDAEKSIDLRLSRNLGIQADRGEDEEGIQIVIPSFHAGDAHSVLLDVVAPGPGPIADVTVRYKDLVHLRNGISRSNLALGRLKRTPGPLELNVVKNFLAYELSEALQGASANVTRNRPETLRRLRAYLALQSEVMRQYRRLQSDPELLEDHTMLLEYVRVLESPALSQPANIQHLMESLQVAGALKVRPQPISLEQ